MSAAIGSKMETLERNWRRVASTHTLQDLMNADKPPTDATISVKTLLSGISLIIAGAACLVLGVVSFGAPWLLPESSNPLIKAVRDDEYYHLLVPVMIPVTIIAAKMQENHNLAQTPSKLLNFLGDLPDFNFEEYGIGFGGLDPQNFNLSPNLLNPPPASLEKIWLASPWPRGAATTPQDLRNYQTTMQTLGLLDSAPRAQRPPARNVDPLSLPLLPLPQKAPSFSTVGTQTSPGLECNGQFHGNGINPNVNRTSSNAPSAVAGKKSNAARSQGIKRNSLPQQGDASLPPLPKKVKKSYTTAPAVATSKPQSNTTTASLALGKKYDKNNNYFGSLSFGDEITGTSLPSNAPIPSRGAKALNVAKTGQGALPKTNNKKKKKASVATKTAKGSSSYAPSAHPSTITAPTAPISGVTFATTTANTTATTATNSAYDSLLCEICGFGEPDDSIILCDGCDLGYHMECLHPRLTEIPQGSWFCGGCCNKLATQMGFQQQQHRQAQPLSRFERGVTAPPAVPPPFFTTNTTTTDDSRAHIPPSFQMRGSLPAEASLLLKRLSADHHPPSNLALAQLQTLIYLAEHGKATTSRLREHYNNPNISSAPSKLHAVGIVIPVGGHPTKTVYSLNPSVVPNVEKWKERVEAYTRALELTQQTTEIENTVTFFPPGKKSRHPVTCAADVEEYPLSSSRRAKLQFLCYLAQFGESTTSSVTQHYKNVFKNATTPLMEADLIVRMPKQQCKPYTYALAPNMQQYADLWKEKLERDAVAIASASRA